jgi:Putative peptidoglycan binding domain
MKTSESISIVFLTVTMGFGTTSASETLSNGGFGAIPGEEQPAHRVVQSDPIFPRPPQQEPRPNLPWPTPPRPNEPMRPGDPVPGLPQTDPIPGRPQKLPEERQTMVITAEHIKQAQDVLRAKGLTPGEDGKLDDKTQQALQAFQKMNGLPVTGVLDDKTAAKLGINLASERR